MSGLDKSCDILWFHWQPYLTVWWRLL